MHKPITQSRRTLDGWVGLTCKLRSPLAEIGVVKVFLPLKKYSFPTTILVSGDLQIISLSLGCLDIGESVVVYSLTSRSQVIPC